MLSSKIQEKYIPFVLCAGFGTRLKPLTDFIPKVVCPLIDKPFAFYNIEKFFKAGFQTVHCNIHYLPEVVKIELINACKHFGYDPNRIRFWHEENILETGGGVTRIFKELCREDPENENKDLIVVSGDIVADFPLSQFVQRWECKTTNELALLCTKNLKNFRKDATYLNDDLTYVLGFGENFAKKESNKNLPAKVFTNHQIISAKVVKNCLVEKKSSIDLFYRPIINSGNKVINFNYDESLYWFNIGTPQEYLESIQFFIENKENCINYAFSIPASLNEKVINYLKTAPEKKSLEDKNSIFISFRSTEKKLDAVVSLNDLCHNTSENNSIFLII